MADVEMSAGGAPAAPAAPVVTDATNSAIETKYKDASIIANMVLQELMAAIAPEKNIIELCELGDSRIEQELAKVYKKAKVDKGVGFPTCISVNECVGHYSPLKSDPKVALKDGDVVKIDLGVHIDGYLAMVAHTVVVGAGAGAPVTGEKADVITAAHQAAEVALRLIKPGCKNIAVTEAIEKVAAAYGVKCIMTMQCQEVKQWVIEADKTIPLRNDPSLGLGKYKEEEFKLGEVYAVDIAMTTGPGNPREAATRTTVFRRVLEVTYQNKMQASRNLMSEVKQRFPSFPFTLRAFADENSARLGITEPLKHNVVASYPILYEKEGSTVSHVKFTAILLANGTFKATGFEVPEYVKSDKSLPADLAALRAQPSYVKPVKAAKPAADATMAS